MTDRFTNKRPKTPNFISDEQDENIFEGKNTVLELLRGGKQVEKLYIASGVQGLGQIISLARQGGAPVVECDRRKLDQMSQTGAHQGVIAVASPVAYAEISDILQVAKQRGQNPLIVLCDGITDPHNLGAIIRSAEVFGAHGLIIPRRRSAGINAACAKAAAGAIEHIKIAKVANLPTAIEELKQQGLFVMGADMSGNSAAKVSLSNTPLALVIGSEGDGLSHLVKQKCDTLIAIPQYGKIPSLNASNAAAVLLYEIKRQGSV